MSTPQPTSTLRSLNELLHNFKYETNPKKSKVLKTLLALIYQFIERLNNRVKNKRHAPLVSQLHLTNRVKFAFYSLRHAVIDKRRDQDFMHFIRLKMVLNQLFSKLAVRLKSRVLAMMARRVSTSRALKRSLLVWMLYLEHLDKVHRHRSDVAIQRRGFVANRRGYMHLIRNGVGNFRQYARRHSIMKKKEMYSAAYCLEQSNLYRRRLGKHLIDGFFYYHDLYRHETIKYNKSADHHTARVMKSHLHLWKSYMLLLAKGRKRAATIAVMSGAKEYSIFFDYLPKVLRKFRLHATARKVARHSDRQQLKMYQQYTISVAFSVLRANNKMDEHTLHYCNYWRKRLRGKSMCKSALVTLKGNAITRQRRRSKVRRKLKAVLQKYVPQRLAVWKFFVSNRVYFITRHLKKMADNHFLRKQFLRLGTFYTRVTRWVERIEVIKHMLELRYSFSLVTARIRKEIAGMKIARYYVIRKYGKGVIEYFIQNANRSHHNRMSQYRGWKEFKNKNYPVYFKIWRRWKSMKKFVDKRLSRKVRQSSLHVFRIAIKKWKFFRTRTRQKRYQAYLYQNEVMKFFLARWKDAAKVGTYESYKIKVVRQLDRKKKRTLLSAAIPRSDTTPELTRAILKRKYVLSTMSLQTDTRRKKLKKIYKHAGIFRDYYKVGRVMFSQLSDMCLVRQDYEKAVVMSTLIRLYLFLVWRWYAYSSRIKAYRKETMKARSHFNRRKSKRALKILLWNVHLRQKCKLVGRPIIRRSFIKYYHAFHSILLMKRVINRMLSGYLKDMQRTALHEWRLDTVVSRRLEHYLQDRIGELFVARTRKWMRRARLNFRRKLRVAKYLRMYHKNTVGRSFASLLRAVKLHHDRDKSRVKYDKYYIAQLLRRALTKIILLWLAKKAFLQSEIFEKRRLIRRLTFHREMKMRSKAVNNKVRLLPLRKAMRILRNTIKKRFMIEFNNRFDHTLGAILRCNVYKRGQRNKLLKLVDKWHIQRFGFLRLASVLERVHIFKRFRKRVKKCTAYYERNAVRRAFKRLLANRRVRRKFRFLLQCTKKYSEKKAKMTIVRRLDIISCFRFSERESIRLVSKKHATKMSLLRGVRALTTSVINKNKSFIALQSNISSIF